MSVRSSHITSLLDFADEVVLRESGTFETTDAHEQQGVRVPRRDTAAWHDGSDYNWTLCVVYDAQGAGPFAVEIWASDGPGVPDVCVLNLPIPPNTKGEMRSLVTAGVLSAIPPGPLYLSVRSRVSNGALDAGVSLRRAT